MRAVSALYVLRDQVIRPVLAGVRATHHAPQPPLAPALERHYERLRLDLQPVFQELGIAA
jgi:urease accessory protein UreE